MISFFKFFRTCLLRGLVKEETSEIKTKCRCQQTEVQSFNYLHSPEPFGTKDNRQWIICTEKYVCPHMYIHIQYVYMYTCVYILQRTHIIPSYFKHLSISVYIYENINHIYKDGCMYTYYVFVDTTRINRSKKDRDPKYSILQILFA